MSRLKFWLIPIIVLFLSASLFAQDYYPYADRNYGFIRYEKNIISFPGDSGDFENLYNKLDKVIKTGEGKINIVHIGGSHIQAGYYSGVVRKKMQTFFPGLNGGRGLIFPYQMAKTNNPKIGP